MHHHAEQSAPSDLALEPSFCFFKSVSAKPSKISHPGVLNKEPKGSPRLCIPERPTPLAAPISRPHCSVDFLHSISPPSDSSPLGFCSCYNSIVVSKTQASGQKQGRQPGETTNVSTTQAYAVTGPDRSLNTHHTTRLAVVPLEENVP